MELNNLDQAVINALNLFIKTKLPRIKIPFKHPLIVGSGNAAVTGKIILNDQDAVFADESNYLDKIKKIKVDGAILISASGGKHAPIIAKELKKKKIKTILITNNKDAEAAKFIDKTYTFPKNIESYTYNVSTYLGMILSKTNENPKKILSQINKIKDLIPKNFKKYDSYYILIPEKFELIREMFLTKFDELFGPKISARVFTIEQTKHAKTIVSSSKELFIGLGVDNKLFGTQKLNIPLSNQINFGEMIAVGYYVIGQIQKQNPQYFKKNIDKYTRKVSQLFNQEIKPIVK